LLVTRVPGREKRDPFPIRQTRAVYDAEVRHVNARWRATVKLEPDSFLVTWDSCERWHRASSRASTVTGCGYRIPANSSDGITWKARAEHKDILSLCGKCYSFPGGR
jgi:hypothetical protein